MICPGWHKNSPGMKVRVQRRRSKHFFGPLLVARVGEEHRKSIEIIIITNISCDHIYARFSQALSGRGQGSVTGR